LWHPGGPYYHASSFADNGIAILKTGLSKGGWRSYRPKGMQLNS
jgi:hypothetical protein